MTTQIADFVQENCNSPGNANVWNLAGAIPGFNTFASAFADGAYVYTYAVGADGSNAPIAQWGRALLTHGSPNKLTWQLPLYGNSAGSTGLLNFVGEVDVYSEVPAQKAPIIDENGTLSLPGGLNLPGNVEIAVGDAGGDHISIQPTNNGTTDHGQVTINVASTSNAGIAFNINSVFATSILVKSDNALHIGGWSWGDDRWKLDGGGNTTQPGTVNANAAALTGALTAVSGAFSANVTANSVSATAVVSGVSGSFSGSLSAPTLGRGTSTTGVATTAFVQDAFGARSLTGSGYQYFPGGLILQWGSGVMNTSSGANITFPLAFPNSCSGAAVTPQITSSTAFCTGGGSFSKTGFTAWAATGSGATASGLGFYWFAWGY